MLSKPWDHHTNKSNMEGSGKKPAVMKPQG